MTVDMEATPDRRAAKAYTDEQIAEAGVGVALGETSTTAYRGDRGKTAYDFSQSHTGATDPHGDRAYAAGLVDDLSGVTNASTARTNLGLGSLATASTITSAEITDGTIVNADISGSAAIALSKLATDPLARANHTGTQAASTVTGLPWAYGICIEPSSQKPNTFTTWTPTQATVLGAGYTAGAMTASGETWTYAGLPLKAGTWALELVIRKTSSSGIITCSLGGSSVGTADGFNASNLGDQRVVVNSSITVASDGQYDLVLTNPTKNASSGGWGWTIQVIDLRRTGA